MPDTNLYFLSTLTSSLLLFWLILLIVFHGKSRQTKRYFTLMTLGIIGWIVSNYLSNAVKKYQMALFWNKIIFITTSLAGWAFLLFTDVFPEEKRLKNAFFWLGLSGVIFISFLSLNQLLIKEIIIKENVSEIIFGPGVYFYVGYLLFCLILGFSRFIGKYFSAKGVMVKKTIRLFGIGMGIFLSLSLISNLIFPVIFKKFDLTNLAPLYTIFFILVVFFAIFYYEFLETKVILTEILVGIIGIFLIAQVFIATNSFLKILHLLSFISFSIGGWLLIRYTLREIEKRKELERLAQAKTEFLSIASHQLRTPLSVIKGYLSMILEGNYGALTENLRRRLENIYISNERLIKLANDLLSATKIEMGKMEMNLEKVDLEELIKEQIKELEIKAKEKNLYLKFENPKEKIPKLILDREKIRQVILNLIDNGIKYTRFGGVSVSLEKQKNFVRIKVRDTGEGLTKEEKEKLFESFSRGVAGMKFFTEGAGLGLYITRKLVEMHGGKIWVESEGRGKGSTFFVQLPINEKNFNN